MPQNLPPATRTRGRPAKLSREQILQCALKMMQRTPDRKITMTGVARSLDTAPMSLYTHVRHRDDLIDGIAEMVLGQLKLELNPRQPWQRQIRQWMTEVYDHLAKYPQIVELLGQSQHIPPAWLHVHEPLIRCLQQSGLKGKTLALTSQWIAQQVIGSLILGFARRDSQNPVSDLGESLERLSDSERKTYRAIMSHVVPDMAMFPFTVDRVIDALTSLIDG